MSRIKPDYILRWIHQKPIIFRGANRNEKQAVHKGILRLFRNTGDSKDIFHENFMPDVIVEGDENLLQVATVSKGNYF